MHSSMATNEVSFRIKYDGKALAHHSIVMLKI